MDEWDDMVDYARRYLDIVRLDYKIIWWRIFNATDANKWRNVLPIVELLFSLPMSNGRLERIFSQLKLLKSKSRTRLTSDSLDQLVRITVEGPSLQNWNAAGALDLWFNDKSRRVHQNSQKSKTQLEPCSLQRVLLDETTADSLNLEDWDEWMNSSESDSD